MEGNPLNRFDPLGLSSLIACANPANAAACAAAGIIPEGTAGTSAAVNAVGIAVGATVAPPVEMAKGGKESGRNWATENAKVEAQARNVDPCDVLKEWREEARAKGDRKQVKDIERAEKYLDCRNKAKRKEKHRCQ